MQLEIELAYFQAHVAEWMEHHANKFALVKGEALEGVFDTPANAYAEGVRKHGRELFLVKRISQPEESYQNLALSLGLINARI